MPLITGPSHARIPATRIVLLLLCWVAAGCDEVRDPTTPGVTSGPEVPRPSWDGEWVSPTGLSRFPDGNWAWRWETSRTTGDEKSICGTARLKTETTGEKFHWQWRFFPSPPGDDPLPLPSLAIESSAYANLVDFLVELTTPFFGGIVTHWPDLPVPVRLGNSRSGDIDLSGCLAEAMARWNEGEAAPWFVADENAAWGVRLIHFPDVTLSPSLQARITRLDDGGRPLRINIVAGNNYTDPRVRKYVVRGFVHELGHALFLWGHSTDRLHCLWGAAPPLVDGPSLDERKAARLWHGLPEGLDLNRRQRPTSG